MTLETTFDNCCDRAVLQNVYGGLLQLIRLVGVLGQAHEQHGKRGIRNDRRTGGILRGEQKPTERQRHRSQTRNSRHSDQQIQPHALIEQRLCCGFAAPRQPRSTAGYTPRIIPTEIIVNRPLAMELLLE